LALAFSYIKEDVLWFPSWALEKYQRVRLSLSTLGEPLGNTEHPHPPHPKTCTCVYQEEFFINSSTSLLVIFSLKKYLYWWKHICKTMNLVTHHEEWVTDSPIKRSKLCFHLKTEFLSSKHILFHHQKNITNSLVDIFSMLFIILVILRVNYPFPTKYQQPEATKNIYFKSSPFHFFFTPIKHQYLFFVIILYVIFLNHHDYLAITLVSSFLFHNFFTNDIIFH
jgi:hypothetical protein